MTYFKSAYGESTIHICLVTLEVEPEQLTVVETPFAVQARRFRSSLLLSIAKTSEAKSRSPLDRLIIPGTLAKGLAGAHFGEKDQMKLKNGTVG